jgi:hypothetical protein
MTNDITLAKQQFAAVLTAAGLEVVSYVPDRVTPPVVIIKAGSPYLSPETLGQEWQLNIVCALVATTQMNELATEKLEDLIETFAKSMPHYARLTNVDQPYTLVTGNAEYFAADASVTLSITIN